MTILGYPWPSDAVPNSTGDTLANDVVVRLAGRDPIAIVVALSVLGIVTMVAITCPRAR